MSGKPSLTRSRVCSLQMMVGLAGAVILGSEFPPTHHNLLSQILDSPTRRVRFMYFTQKIKLRVKVISWPTVSRSVSPGIRSPSGIRDQVFFLVLGAYFKIFVLFSILFVVFAVSIFKVYFVSLIPRSYKRPWTYQLQRALLNTLLHATAYDLHNFLNVLVHTVNKTELQNYFHIPLIWRPSGQILGTFWQNNVLPLSPKLHFLCFTGLNTTPALCLYQGVVFRTRNIPGVSIALIYSGYTQAFCHFTPK
jgi:hypothetical protein